VGGSSGIALAAVDAFRGELLDAGPDALLESTRLGVRLTPDRLAAFQDQLAELTRSLKDADDPAGDPVSLYVGLHRQRR
jgi:hypothetical protein